MSNLKKWKTLKSKMVLDNPWCQVRQDEIELPNARIIDNYFVSIKPDVAMVLPITSSEEIILVLQYLVCQKLSKNPMQSGKYHINLKL